MLITQCVRGMTLFEFALTKWNAFGENSELSFIEWQSVEYNYTESHFDTSISMTF